MSDLSAHTGGPDAAAPPDALAAITAFAEGLLLPSA